MKPFVFTLRCVIAAGFIFLLMFPVVCANAASSSDEPAASSVRATAPATISDEGVIIPGPLRSFLRMAGISQKISLDEVVPLLARNVFSIGYSRNRPTEFLTLLDRYVRQARELEAMAGPHAVIYVSNCAEAAPLLHVLGYRLRQNCGNKEATLVTADAERAFLTIDSGFPLPALEEALQKGSPFTYAFPSTRVPVLFSESDWVATSKESGGSHNLVDVLLRDPAMARLYWAMSHADSDTRTALRQSPGLRNLLPFAGVLDFYGGYLSIRGGHVVVPGGMQAEAQWKDLVGAAPDQPTEFIFKLLSKDRGWLAAYFDVLSRVSESQQVHFTERQKLKRYYTAFRMPAPNTDASKQTFRPAPALLLLVTRVQWDSNDQPHIPGNMQVWKEILGRDSSKVSREWARRAAHWKSPDQLLEALFSLSRQETEVGPTQIYLMLSELDSARPKDRQVSPKTALLLANTYSKFSNQYLMFSEFPELSDDSIDHFVDVVEQVDGTSSHGLRGNAMGSFQATVGLWQILARQGEIPLATLNDSWRKVIDPFSKISSSAELFDATSKSVEALTRTASGKARCSQDEFISLLAGPQQEGEEGRHIHAEMAGNIRAVMDAQRLVPLDTLLGLGDGLRDMARGAAIGEKLVPLAKQLNEFQMPRPIFTGGERTKWASGIFNDRHTELQMKTDLVKAIRSHAPREAIGELRGEVSSFLRDTLVGLNYAYYEPPGAQVLLNNPLFVRSHDFAGDTVIGIESLWQAPQLFGVGSPAGGGAHLVGSLADLPYVLAQVEQDFIAPENVQALIWRELAPGLLASAKLGRWWNVSANELHAVALYQRSGEELLRAAGSNEELRNKVVEILSHRMSPSRLEVMDRALQTGKLEQALPQFLPADAFYLMVEFRQKFPSRSGSAGPAALELDSLSHQYPGELSWERLSHDFGVPHPALAHSYSPELLDVQLFPAFEGYSSRLLAESWDSSNLYWARLADEMGYSPVLLNRMVPELTRRMVAKIFGTDLEDWPALLRAMHETGEDFRQGKIVMVSDAIKPGN